MKHYSDSQWQAYANGSDVDRAVMDVHLAECDDCMMRYGNVIHIQSANLPQLRNIDEFVSNVVHRTHSRAAQISHLSKPRRWYSQPILHYGIAASITIILVSSGTFQHLFDRYSDLSRETELSSNTAISERWTNKAGQWLNDIPNNLNKKEVKP